MQNAQLAGRRIVFVHDFFGPGDAPIGGSGRVLQIIALGCQSAGAQPVVLVDKYSKGAQTVDRWTRDGLPVHQFPLLRSVPSSSKWIGETRFRQWVAERRFPRMLDTVKPELVHIHVDFPNGLLRLGLECKRRAGVKIIVTSHGLEGFGEMAERYDQAKFEPDWIEAVEAVDVWVPCGPADHVELVRWGIPESKIRPINNGVSVPDRLPPRSCEANAKTISIAYIGNITGTKGVFDLAKAMGEFVKQAPEIRPRFLLVGNLSPAVRQILDETLAPVKDRVDVELPGHVSPDEVRAIQQSADIFCYPSRRREGIPMAILEAAAHGCPLVVSDAPGHMGVLTPDVHAVVHKARDVDSLADGLVRAARDPALRTRIREAAYRHVKDNFTREQMVKGYLALYEEMLSP